MCACGRGFTVYVNCSTSVSGVDDFFFFINTVLTLKSPPLVPQWRSCVDPILFAKHLKRFPPKLIPIISSLNRSKHALTKSRWNSLYLHCPPKKKCVIPAGFNEPNWERSPFILQLRSYIDTQYNLTVLLLDLKKMLEIYIVLWLLGPSTSLINIIMPMQF